MPKFCLFPIICVFKEKKSIIAVAAFKLNFVNGANRTKTRLTLQITFNKCNIFGGDGKTVAKYFPQYDVSFEHPFTFSNNR